MIDTPDFFFKQLIDFYRTPLEHPDFADSRKPLPAQSALLLESLSGSGDKFTEIARSLEVDPLEYREAAFFYIKQQFFSSSADYYRVLGVNRDASIDQIKKHYRALISLFHPDKNPDADAWDEMYAPRLNEAYNVLKKAQQKSDYDAQLTKPAVDSDAWAVAQHPVKRPVVKPKPVQFRVYTESPLARVSGSRVWQRFPKLVVMGGLGAIFLAYVGWSQRTSHVVSLKQKKIEVTEQTGELQQTELEREREALRSMLHEQEAETVTQAAAAQSAAPMIESAGLVEDSPPEGPIAPLPTVAAPSGEMAAADRGESGPGVHVVPDPEQATQSADISKATARQTHLVESEREPAEQVATAVPFTKKMPERTKKSQPKPEKVPVNVASTESSEQPTAAANEQLADSAAEVDQPVVLPVAKPVALPEPRPAPLPERAPVTPAVAAPIVAVVSTPPVEEPPEVVDFKPEPMVTRYVSLYQSGELMGMMGLFTADATIDGKQGIKYVAQYYDRLFRTTVGRELELSQVQKFLDSPARTQLQLQANIINKPAEGGQLQRYAGKIEMEIVQIEERQFISRLTQHLIKE